MLWIDWLIVGLYLLAAVGLGVVFARKASHSTTDFFVAGRSLPWWIAGTSLVATTFSTDTPLFVAGLSRNEGIHGNWFWWSAAIGQTATIFFFAKYWRRSEALTEIEFVAQRYDDGPERSVLRIFKVLFDGVFVNCIIIASVTLAATKVIEVVLGVSPSVVAGLIDGPVIAVPTSVGYGASFGGLAALLGMLNSCGSGVTVVNIDNGFGAGFAASKINRVAQRAG